MIAGSSTLASHKTQVAPAIAGSVAVTGAPDTVSATGTLGLKLADWEEIGFYISRSTLAQSGQNLQVTHNGGSNPSQFGIALVGVSVADVRIRGRMTLTGWEAAVDQPRWGPAARISGTVIEADWNAYLNLQRRISTDNFTKCLRKWVAGVGPDTLGTDITGLSSAAWLDQSVSFLFEVQGTTIRSKMWLSSVAEPGAFDQTVTDASIAGAGRVGMFAQSMRPTNILTLHEFTWEAL